MFTEGSFWNSVNNIKLLLKKLNILKEDNTYKRGNYSKEFLEIMYSDSYQRIYETSLRNFDYELLLKDNSFFQFSYKNDSISMAFYPRPSEYYSFEQYLYNVFRDDIDKYTAEELEFFREEMGLNEDYFSEYEQYLIELNQLKNIVPIRFDYDDSNYHPIYHPLCHFHIGVANDIRIASDKHPTPYHFCLFVLKNYFTDLFFDTETKTKKKILNNKIDLKNKSSCINVPKNKFEGEDTLFYFT